MRRDRIGGPDIVFWPSMRRPLAVSLLAAVLVLLLGGAVQALRAEPEAESRRTAGAARAGAPGGAAEREARARRSEARRKAAREAARQRRARALRRQRERARRERGQARRRELAAASAPGLPSRAMGLPHRGALIRGVRLPAEGVDFFTWDPILEIAPNRAWRRYGTDRLVITLLEVLAQYRAANPGAPRVAIGDLSRPRGGNFGRRFGGLGHASHQNGLDVDVYYPRRDAEELAPETVRQVDLELSQDLVDRLVAAGARYVFVGPRTGLRGPRNVVQKLAHHDDHLHFRLPPGAEDRPAWRLRPTRRPTRPRRAPRPRPR